MTDASADVLLPSAGAAPHAMTRARNRYTRRTHDLAALRSAMAGVARLETLEPASATALWAELVAGKRVVTARLDRGGDEYLLVRRATERRTSRLTPRELQVASLAAAGLSNKAMAFDLGLSVSTVSVYLMKAAEKLGASTRVELIKAFRPRGRHGPLVAFAAPHTLRAWCVGSATHLVVHSTKERPLPSGLTSAELAVAQAILEGCTNEEIARVRTTSTRTIANQVASIFRKLGIGSRGELAARFATGRVLTPRRA
jgi:DNA-binding NarL/FixJ family response regulator